MGVALVAAFALLLIGNALLLTSSLGFERVYTDHITADLTVAAGTAQEFTLFGSQAFLVGEHEVPPTLTDGPELLEALRRQPGVAAAGGLVSANARLEIDDAELDHVLFGVDFAEYRELFPDLELVSGEWPEPGRAAIILQEERYRELGDELGRELEPGEPVLLTSASANSFTIREVRLAGVFRYPVSDPQLDRVALIDAPTARALNGHIYARAPQEDEPGEDDLFEEEIDDMFATRDDAAGDDTAPDDTAEADEITLEMVEEQFAAEAPAGEVQAGVEGAWSFALVRSSDPSATPRSVASALEAEGFAASEYLVRGWRTSAGGSALLVTVLQIVLNLGLAFVTLGALAVTSNALVLSVLERSREIGTLRAMGAHKPFVAALIAGEAIVFVLAAAAVGLLLGGAGAAVLNRAGIEIANPLLVTLFGSERLYATVTMRLVLYHLAGGVLVSLLAVLYPLKRVLGIGPVRAMAGDSQHD